MENGFIVSTDKAKLDVAMVHHFLANESYWAKGRSLQVVRKSIDNSLCFGVYKGDKQVGFARIVSDYAVFAWVLDVFIISEHRRNGLGKMLMNAIVTHSELQNLQRWGLATEDAQRLYERYGFKTITKPDTFMEIVSKPS
jgi:GNAT superfamily N-acetyltransferase